MYVNIHACDTDAFLKLWHLVILCGFICQKGQRKHCIIVRKGQRKHCIIVLNILYLVFTQYKISNYRHLITRYSGKYWC